MCVLVISNTQFVFVPAFNITSKQQLDFHPFLPTNNMSITNISLSPINPSCSTLTARQPVECNEEAGICRRFRLHRIWYTTSPIMCMCMHKYYYVTPLHLKFILSFLPILINRAVAYYHFLFGFYNKKTHVFKFIARDFLFYFKEGVKGNTSCEKPIVKVFEFCVLMQSPDVFNCLMICPLSRKKLSFWRLSCPSKLNNTPSVSHRSS